MADETEEEKGNQRTGFRSMFVSWSWNWHRVGLDASCSFHWYGGWLSSYGIPTA